MDRRTRLIVWSVLLGAQVLYVGIGWSGVARVGDEPPGIPGLVTALAVVAAATAVGAHWSWRRASGAGRAVHAPPPEPQAIWTHSILAWVLDESIAVYGLMLALLSHGPAAWAPFSVLAFVFMLLHRPR